MFNMRLQLVYRIVRNDFPVHKRNQGIDAGCQVSHLYLLRCDSVDKDLGLLLHLRIVVRGRIDLSRSGYRGPLLISFGVVLLGIVRELLINSLQVSRLAFPEPSNEGEEGVTLKLIVPVT